MHGKIKTSQQSKNTILEKWLQRKKMIIHVQAQVNTRSGPIRAVINTLKKRFCQKIPSESYRKCKEYNTMQFLTRMIDLKFSESLTPSHSAMHAKTRHDSQKNVEYAEKREHNSQKSLLVIEDKLQFT